MKRCFICIFMLLAVLVLASPAQAEEFSGTCGDHLTWSFDASAGTLTISGQGAMKDYPFSAVEESKVPWYAHRNKITTVVMEPGITHIGSNSFYFSDSLVSVTIPDTVTSIGACAFYECTALKKVDLPGSITEIDYRLFYGCSSLTEVRFPDGLKTIASRMFEGCTSLAMIDLPETVTTVGFGAFMECESLMSIRIPATVELVENYAFEDCSRLLAVAFMGPAPKFEARAFESSYPTIYYPAGDTSWTQTVMNGVSGDLAWVAVENPAEVKLPKPGDVLEGSCGENAKWRLENGTLTITGTGVANASKWFGFRSEITTVVVGEGITDFGNVVWSNVEEITLPSTLTVINGGAFRQCTKLEQIIIPAGVTKIGSGAFKECTSLKRVVLPDGIKRIENDTFSNCTALEEIVLPGTLEFIGEYAFASCTSLTKIVFPKGLKEIGTYAFLNCKNLKCVIYQGDAPQISIFAFYGLAYYAYYPAGNKTWTEDLRNSLYGDEYWIAGDGANSGTCADDLRWKVQGDTLTISGQGRMMDYYIDKMGPWAGHNAQIKKVVIEEGVTYIGKFAFYLMNGFTSLELPDSLLEIGGGAFSGCGGLLEVHIPDNVTKIGVQSFAGLLYLRTLTFGNSLETIGESAFYDCQWLEPLVFPASLKSIGRYAFSMCTHLTSVTFLGPAPSIAQDTFELDNLSLYYPAREESWKTAAQKYLLGVKEKVAQCIPDHTMGEWETIKEPTEDLFGEEQRQCIYCEELEVRDIPKLQPEGPAPTDPTVTEPSQPTVTDPTEATKPTAPTEKAEENKPGSMFVIVFIVAAVLVSGGAVTLAFLCRRK